MAGTDVEQRPSGNDLAGDTADGGSGPDKTKALSETQETQETQTPILPQEYMTGWQFAVVYGSLLLAAALFALNGAMLGTAAASITNAFHSIKDLSWYNSAYFIATCSMLPLSGKLFVIFPLKPTFLAFIFVFALGSLISGVAPSSLVVIIGRAVTGVGGSGAITGATTIITRVRPRAKRPLLIGIQMGVVATGQVAGPLLGGVLAERSWRWVFYINLPFCGLILVLFTFFVHLPEAPKTQTPSADEPQPAAPPRAALRATARQLASIDYVGFVLFSAACVLLLLGLEWGGTTYAWSAPVVGGVLAGGGAGFIAFALWSGWQGDAALLPPRVVLQYDARVSILCGVVSFVQAGSISVLLYYLPVWFQGVKGASPLRSGVMLLPTIVAQMLTAVACGWTVQRTGYYLPPIVFGCSLVVVSSGLLTLFTPTTPAAQWIGFQVVGGAGRGIVMQLLVTVIQACVPPADVPLAVSYVLFCQYLGRAVVVCATRTVFTATLPPALRRYAPSVDVQRVINTGVTELRTALVTNPPLLAAVLRAYNAAIVDVFRFQLAATCLAFVCSCFLGWRDIRKPRDFEPAADDDGGEGARDSPAKEAKA